MYRWVDHTAELELEIEAPTEAEVLADALAALAELLAVVGENDEPRWERAERRIHVSAPDRPALLAAWIEELVFLAESEGFVPARVSEIEVEAEEARATVMGFTDDPPPLVKAVTYHRLVFEPAGQGYVARVVLDV